LVSSATVDPDALQLPIPFPPAGPRHVVDGRRRRDLLPQIGLGAREADVGDADAHPDGLSVGIESDVAARATARAVRAGRVPLAAAVRGGARRQLVVAPRAVAGEVVVERRAEVQFVVALAVVLPAVGAPATERSGQHPSGYLALLRVDVDVGVR